MKICLHGTEDECLEVAERLVGVVEVLAVSALYPDRGASVLVRVYVEALIAPPGHVTSTTEPRPRGRRRVLPPGGVPVNGPAHYREADNCVRQGCAADERGAQADAMAWLALGQIHATLALAAAYAAGGAIMRLEDRDGRDRSTDTTQVYTLLADQVADTEIRAARRKRDTRRGRPAKDLKAHVRR